jgi:hypothetical protein
LNPARSFGPAIFTEAIKAGTPDWQNPLLYLIYFVGPFIGSIIAVLLYQLFRDVPELGEELDEAEEIEELEVEEELIFKEPVKKATRKPAVRKTTKK